MDECVEVLVDIPTDLYSKLERVLERTHKDGYPTIVFNDMVQYALEDFITKVEEKYSAALEVPSANELKRMFDLG